MSYLLRMAYSEVFPDNVGEQIVERERAATSILKSKNEA